MLNELTILLIHLKDENPEESWHLLTENDLVALFEQFPFEGLFQYLLFMNNAEGSYIINNYICIVSA